MSPQFLLLAIVLAQSSAIALAYDALSTIYQFKVPDAEGNDVNLSKYQGKVVIIVNGASFCTFTKSNYRQLQILYDKYHSQGLEIAVFPCNQFAGQEPDDGKNVKRFIKNVFGFEPDVYEKINVNGPDEHPLYTYLKQQQGGTLTDHIKWNFTKFLISREGHVLRRYSPTTEPLEMEKDILELLGKHAEL